MSNGKGRKNKGMTMKAKERRLGILRSEERRVGKECRL